MPPPPFEIELLDITKNTKNILVFLLLLKERGKYRNNYAFLDLLAKFGLVLFTHITLQPSGIFVNPFYPQIPCFYFDIIIKYTKTTPIRFFNIG
jgi:hypothetical protein